MNLKKIVLYVLLAAILALGPSACAPKQTLLVDKNLNQVMHQIAEIPSGVESGSYHLFCYEDLNLHYWWTSDRTIIKEGASYRTSLSYTTSKVTVSVFVTKDTRVVFDKGIIFDKGMKNWSQDLLLLAKDTDYEKEITRSLESIDLDQILSSVDKEALILLSQYACVYAD